MGYSVDYHGAIQRSENCPAGIAARRFNRFWEASSRIRAALRWERCVPFKSHSCNPDQGDQRPCPL